MLWVEEKNSQFKAGLFIEAERNEMRSMLRLMRENCEGWLYEMKSTDTSKRPVL